MTGGPRAQTGRREGERGHVIVPGPGNWQAVKVPAQN